MEDRVYDHETVQPNMTSSHHLNVQGTNQKRRGTTPNTGFYIGLLHETSFHEKIQVLSS